MLQQCGFLFFNLCSFYTKPFTFEALREQADLCLLRLIRLPVQVILFACDTEGKKEQSTLSKTK